MKKILLIPILLCAIPLFAQGQDSLLLQKQQGEITVLKQRLNNQQKEIAEQQSHLDSLSVKSENQLKRLDSLNLLINYNTLKIQSMADELGTKIQQTETTAKDSISQLDKNVNQRSEERRVGKECRYRWTAYH